MRHYCGPCQTVFKTGQEKSLHVVLKHSELKCDLCASSSSSAKSSTFTSAVAFAQHRLREHGLYYCPFCSYIVPK